MFSRYELRHERHPSAFAAGDSEKAGSPLILEGSTVVAIIAIIVVVGAHTTYFAAKFGKMDQKLDDQGQRLRRIEDKVLNGVG